MTRALGGLSRYHNAWHPGSVAQSHLEGAKSRHMLHQSAPRVVAVPPSPNDGVHLLRGHVAARSGSVRTGAEEEGKGQVWKGHWGLLRVVVMY